jgi:hypothetical protein
VRRGRGDLTSRTLSSSPPGATDAAPRRLGPVLRIALAGVLILFLLPAQLRPRNFPTDDSLFYLVVARHIATGDGSTFNTVTPTNGYHPLWMVPCVLAATIARGDRDLLLRLVFAMQAALAVGCLLLFRSVARRLGIRSWPVGIPVVAAFLLTGLYASEAHLNAFLILASLLLLLRQGNAPSRGGVAALGICLGFTFLARLDDLFLVAAIAVAATAIGPRGGTSRWKDFAILSACATAVALPYLTWNVLAFGHLVPISGAIKSTFPHVVGDLRNLGTLGLIAAGASVVVGASLALPGVSMERRRTLGALSAGVFCHAAYVVTYTNHNTHWSWYYVPGLLLVALGMGMAADALLAGLAPARRRVALGVVVALLTVWGLARDWARFANSHAASHNQLVFELLRPTSRDRWEVQFARWLDAALPPGAGVLTFDYPGGLAYYSHQRIVPTDGLIGSYSYDDELRHTGLAGYLANHSISYYLVPLAAGAADSCRSEAIFDPLTHADAGALQLCSRDMLGSAETIVTGVPAPDVALYRIGKVLPPDGRKPPPVVKHGALWGGG